MTTALDRDEILTHICQLPARDAARIAARAALRVLPLLAELPAQRQSSHLILAVCRACQCAAVGDDGAAAYVVDAEGP